MATGEQQDLRAKPPRPIVAGDLTLGDLGSALADGWRDFLAMPQNGVPLAQ